MLIGGVLLGLVLGLLVGGSIANLASVRLHRIGLLIVAVFLRAGTEILLNQGNPIAETLRVPLLATAFGLLLVALWANRGYPGMSLAFIGVLANAIVIVVNGGYMPVYLPSLELAGLTPADLTTSLHVPLGPALDATFLLHLGPFADVIPIPFPLIQNVASIGDAFLTLGLAFFLFAAVVRVPQELDEEQLAVIRGRLASDRPLRAGDPGAVTGLSPALTGTVALERPLVMGSAGPGLSSPSLSRFEADVAIPGTITVSIPRPVETIDRVRQHPYVRLALNGSFSALWAGQLISLFGDRFNQLALVAVVAISTRLRARDRARVLRGHAPEPAAEPDRGHLRRSLGPQGGHGRQRRPASRPGPAPARRRRHQHHPGLPADLPGHDDLGLLPARAGGDPAADRARGGPAQRELGAVGR